MIESLYLLCKVHIFNYRSLILKVYFIFRGNFSQNGKTYVNLLVAEWQDQQKQISYVSPSTVRGSGNSLDYHPVLLVSQTRQAGYRPGPSRDNARIQINVNPIRHFLHLCAREPSDSSPCGRRCRCWYGFTSPITNCDIAPASCFAFYLAISSRYADDEGPRSFLRILFALNLLVSIIKLRVRSLC